MPDPVIRPPARDWRISSAPLTDIQRRFREQLSLPTDRPIIMTGHQAAFWHPGILAKYLAAAAAARRLGASPAWLVVDQDDPPADTVIRYPARKAGRLTRAQLDLAALPKDFPEPASPSVTTGLARMRAAWDAHANQPSPARRQTAALTDLLAPLIPAAPTIHATDLCRTDLFGSILDRMRADPEACTRAYDAAAAAHPHAGIRPLIADDIQDRFELPLWHIRQGGAGGAPRRRIYAEMLDAIPREQLAPRALFMTALVRIAGCELFIHGTGGGGDADESSDTHDGYDAVTDAWLNSWLGPTRLAPIAVVTATLLLPIPGESAPTPDAAASAAWTAHHARHSPDVLGDSPAAQRKVDLVAQVADAPHDARAPLFHQLQSTLADYRARHHDELSALNARAADLRARLADADILTDRTWPFPLYPDPMLLDLRARIAAAFPG